MVKIPRALTIAGSDSGGGAGIQADLKTFAALGVHGMSAITAITAQNTVGVTAVQGIDPEVVRAQIDAVVEDIGVDVAKTGMLYSAEIINIVAEEAERYRLTMVVDPVMIAKSGASLLKIEAVDTLIRRLLPLATVVTPNAMEAQAISKRKISTLDDAKKAAKEIAGLGAKAVVIKGGHIDSGDRVTDVLYLEERFETYEGQRVDTKNTHGTGCVFASAIAAGLAIGKPLGEAVGIAKEFVERAIIFGLDVGQGYGPVNPTATLHNNAEKYDVLMTLRKAVNILEGHPEVRFLIPESQSNIGMALRNACARDDVCAIPGRVVRLPHGLKASSCPEFGASSHVANTILVAARFNPLIRSAMNIRYSKEVLDVCRNLGLSISYYDRRMEPSEIKRKEGATTAWGAEEAVKRLGAVPDVIYHEGDYGKEPMVIILGRTAIDVANRVVEISQQISRPTQRGG